MHRESAESALAYWGGILRRARRRHAHARRIAEDRMGSMSTFAFYTFSPSWQPLPPFRLD
jgi:hypothetical protein